VFISAEALDVKQIYAFKNSSSNLRHYEVCNKNIKEIIRVGMYKSQFLLYETQKIHDFEKLFHNDKNSNEI
jgi:hypothetical protein